MQSVEETSQAPFVLIAEDSVEDWMLLEYAFRRSELLNPYAIVTNGEDVITWLSFYGRDPRYPLPDLLVLDVHMPQKSGLEVLEWIRTQPCYDNLPVIVMSGIGSKEMINRALAIGAHSYFFKAGDYSELMHFIADFSTLHTLQMEPA